MQTVWTIARREYNLYFTSPFAYVVTVAFLFLLGIFFFQDLAGVLLQATVQPVAPGVQIVLSPLVSLLLFILMPAVTWRSIAEEQRRGTLELLLTAPVRDWELVVGKWLAGFLFALTLLALTWVYPIFLNSIVDPGIDQGPLVTGYIGLILFAGSLIGIGVAVSSFFSNPVAALVVNYIVVLALWLIAPAGGRTDGLGSEILQHLNFIDHYLSFFRGVIDLVDVVYYVSLTALALFIGSVAVEARRWR